MSRSEKRRQARESQAESTKLYYVLGAVAVVGIGLVAYSVGSSAFSSAATEPVELALDNDQELVSLAQGETMGDDAAPVTLVEFGDYQCPGCGAFALQAKPAIEQALVDTGEAKFVFYDFPLVSIHANSFLAARAARCAGDQGQFWEFHQELFRNQTRWSTATMPTSAFEDYAGALGLDEGAFSSCLNSDRFADVVTANLRVGERMGITGTPTLLLRVDGQTRKLNAYDVESIRGAIENMRSGGPGGS